MFDPALASTADAARSATRSGDGDGRPEFVAPTRSEADPWVHQRAIERDETLTPLKLAVPDRRFSVSRKLAATFVLLALVEAAAIVLLFTTGSWHPAAPMTIAGTVPVTIESPIPGEIVMVDGRQVGVTPVNLNVGSSVRLIRVLGHEGSQPAEAPAGTTAATIDARTKANAQAVSAIALASVRQRSGGLKLSSPIELHVFEGDRVLGSSADGPIVTTAGVHQLDLVNTALGYRSRQTVEIKAGQIVPLTIRPPDGRVSINALPWAQVWIDGTPVGETPLANLSVAVGQHEITFRHPQLGERRETTIVQSGTLTRVSASFSR
jgi:hypothetical protein